MATLLAWILAAAAAALLLPAATFAGQCVLGSRRWRPRPPPVLPRPPRLAVLVPAHDEAAGIGRTIRNLLPQLAAGDRLVVVADNCSDGTAAAARKAAPAEHAAALVVLERTDPHRRGKGHALAFGRKALHADPPDALAVLDADCQITAGSIRDLANWAVATGQPVQADNVVTAPAAASPLAAIGAFAFLLRNRVRPRGLARLGLPCQLGGTGMAMPWSLSHAADQLGAQLAEDLVLGLELALDGFPALACPEVAVKSELPVADRDALQQRRRWEHGHLATLCAYAPRLLWRGARTGRLALLALALDLAVPPLALLVMLLLVVAAAAAGIGLLAAPGPAPWLALWLALAGLLAVALGALAGWWAEGRSVVPLRALLLVPFYLLWKVPLYLALLGRRQRHWQRTRRSGEAG